MKVLRSLSNFLSNLEAKTQNENTREPKAKRLKTEHSCESCARGTLFQQFWTPPSQLAVAEARKKLRAGAMACQSSTDVSCKVDG